MIAATRAGGGRRIGIAALVLAALACRPPAPAAAPMAAEPFPAIAARTWATTREAAVELRRRGESAQADSLLTEFRTRFPGTPAATEALFQRALLRADPASRANAPRAAVSDLDAYEAGGELQPHHATSGVIRRLLLQNDSLRLAVAAERISAAVLVPRDSLKPRDDEVVKLRAELEQTRAELDRVRRRLAPRRRP